MITSLEYASLSNQTYHPNDKPSTGMIINPYIKKMTVAADYSGWYEITDLDDFMHPSNPFFAQLYVKYFNGTATDAVVAFRGTVLDCLDNDIVDYQSWCSDFIEFGKHDKTPAYYPQALFFYHDARHYAQEHFNLLHINTTGHSLGGAIAQLISAHGLPATAVSFNSPGIGHLPSLIHGQAGRVHAINSRYGFINKISKHFGQVSYINVPNKEKQAKQAFDDFEQEQNTQHKLAQADSDDDQYKYAAELLLENYCYDARDAADITTSIAAQHSMEHLITAMNEENNAVIAQHVYI
jgi:hypothetical protein